MVTLYNNVIASYDDSQQPTGTIHWTTSGGLIPVPVPHVEMKKLRHELRLIIEGPEGTDVSNCVQQAAFVGLLAGIVAAYLAGGVGVAAGEEAAITVLTACLGSKCNVRFDNSSEWITWDT